jgi:hypothetical protein
VNVRYHRRQLENGDHLPAKPQQLIKKTRLVRAIWRKNPRQMPQHLCFLLAMDCAKLNRAATTVPVHQSLHCFSPKNARERQK